MQDQTLSGQTAVVVGAADGIGRATVTLLAERGVRVACLDRNLGGAQAVVASLPSGMAMAVPVDVQDAESVGSAMSTVTTALGRIDVLVTSASSACSSRASAEAGRALVAAGARSSS